MAGILCPVIRTRCLAPALLALALVVAGCANSGVPESWDEQADESGKGLAERGFLGACVEANGDLAAARSRSYCACVLNKVQAAVTYEEFRTFDDFIDKHRDEVSPAMLGENFGWFMEAVVACPV